MCVGGAESWVLPLYIMVLEGVLCLAVVYHGFTGRGGGPVSNRCISWL